MLELMSVLSDAADMGCVGAGWERHPTQDQEWGSCQLVTGV